MHVDRAITIDSLKSWYQENNQRILADNPDLISINIILKPIQDQGKLVVLQDKFIIFLSFKCSTGSRDKRRICELIEAELHKAFGLNVNEYITVNNLSMPEI
jgi:hypothetical protein